MILSAEGVSQAPSDMVARLKQVDPSLDLKFIYLPTGEYTKSAWWAIVYAWPMNDPRMARVQSGEINPKNAFDIIGYLPLDASPDDAYGWFVKAIKGAVPHHGSHVAKFLEGIDRYNTGVTKAAQEEPLALGEEIAKSSLGTLFDGKGVTKVFT
jgi:hypothetical protein